MKGIVTHQWNSKLNSFVAAKRDIYFKEEYLHLYERHGEQSVAYLYERGDNIFLFPFLIRSFEYKGVNYYDFETAYGYGGPLINTDDVDFVVEAWSSFALYAKTAHIVCGFVRFHPLLRNWNGFNSIGQLIDDRFTIAVDLRGTEEYIWQNEIHTKNRNVIKHGERDKLVFEADYNFSYLDDFRRLYESTMRKLDADSFYYFDDAYYADLRMACTNSFIGIVKKDNLVIAAAIFYYDKCYGHYHLAGSDCEYLCFSPNNFLLWNAALEMKRHDVQLFHIGGGTDSDENNSLFQFKRKFSKSLQEFKIGKIIFDNSVYLDLCDDWEKRNPEKNQKYKNFLLKYKY